ncbi:MAG: hypothetical protein U0176_03685 [Bacteroidia bacterium]
MRPPPTVHTVHFPRIRFGWLIFLCVVIWTAYCQYWMIRSHLKDHRSTGNPGDNGNMDWDLPHNLIFTCLEFILFLAIIRPWSYEILDTATRAGGLALIMFVASFYHLLTTQSSGRVNEIQLGWTGGMLLGSIALLFLGAGAGLVKRIVDGRKRRRGDI